MQSPDDDLHDDVQHNQEQRNTLQQSRAARAAQEPQRAIHDRADQQQLQHDLPPRVAEEESLEIDRCKRAHGSLTVSTIHQSGQENRSRESRG